MNLARIFRITKAASIIPVAVLVVALGARAQSKISTGRFIVSSEMTVLTGSTDYEIDANAFDPDAADSVSRIRSMLEFPLDVTLFGASASLAIGGPEQLWTAEVGFETSVSDPGKLMTDVDWINEFPVSYTESNATVSLVMFSGHIYRRVLTRESTSLDLLAGVSYQKIEQDVVGFDGWQDLDQNGVRSPVRGTDTAIIYEVTYISPELGALAKIDISRSLAANILFTSGMVFASDRDDHPMRGWVSEGDATGVALDSRVDLRFYPPLSQELRLSIGVFGRMRYFYSEGNTTKTWYRDEGSVSAGTVDADIPYTIKSTQPSFGINVGMTF
jgi:hypothetical protein